MSVIKKWLPVLIVFIAISGMAFIAGCSSTETTYESSFYDESDLAKSGIEQLITGKWVVNKYQGIDGKIQLMDTYDPAKRITYIFDEKNIVVKWGNQGDQNGTYEWYINDAKATGISTIVVHFNAVTSGSIKSDSGDVHFDVHFTDEGIRSNLILTVRETGEISTLNREK